MIRIPGTLILNTLRTAFVFILLLTTSNFIFAQKTGLVKGRVSDAFTREPISFANVYWKVSRNGISTDSLGTFKLKFSLVDNDTLVINFMGYAPVTYPAAAITDTSILSVELNPATVKEVIVSSRSGKGLGWWKNIVAHKAANTPRNFETYYCALYTKQEIDINNPQQFSVRKVLKPFENVIKKNTDSTSEAAPFLPIFLSESISDFYVGNKPHKVREEIKGLQTSGIRNESVLAYMEGANQKINTYDDYLAIFGKEFISPVSSIGDKYYEYRGTDTQIINGEKYYHLLFTPKKEGENLFSGDCWIHSSSWALQKISMNISATANINFVRRLSVAQEFQQIQNKYWVVVKDKFTVELSLLDSKDKLSFIGRKTSVYRNIQINQPFIEAHLRQNHRREEVFIGDSTQLRENIYWDTVRPGALSHNEKQIYQMVDTIKSMPAFKKLHNRVIFVFDGHKKFGNVEIGPWYKWVSFNPREGFRFRFDLGTTAKFSEDLRLHGYLAYGTKDEEWKGGADLRYRLGSGWTAYTVYIHDLDNGRLHLDYESGSADNIFSQLIRRDKIVQKYLGIDAKQVQVTKQWPSNFSITTGISNTVYQTYNPLPAKAELITRQGATDIVNTELSLKFRYAPGEKEIARFRKNKRIRGTEPVFELTCAQGIPGILSSDYRYMKIAAGINQRFRIPRWGQIDYTVYGGRIFGSQLPFMLLEIHPGNEVYYYDKNAFNLMNRFEYFSDRYAGIVLEHNFGKKILNLLPFMQKTNVRQFWNVKSVWGDASMENKQFNRTELGGYHLKSLQGQLYTEVGTGFDNIFKFLRIDFVWRFAPDLKLPSGRSLNTTKQSFGVFGSFKLQF